MSNKEESQDAFGLMLFRHLAACRLTFNTPMHQITFYRQFARPPLPSSQCPI